MAENIMALNTTQYKLLMEKTVIGSTYSKVQTH
jgi:ribosomal silencing factor RsfS